MKRLSIITVACFVILTSMIGVSKVSVSKASTKTVNAVKSTSGDATALITMWMDSMYTTLNLEQEGLSKEAFMTACTGYEYLLGAGRLTKSNLLTVADFSKSSATKRLFVIDMANAKILFNTYVSHGRNSGSEYATSFSNQNDSHKSSLGFMVTAETYNGDNGYSMRFDGMESSINNNVRMRDIVMHGSNYVNGDRALNGSMMGRSYGCPAVPAAECKKIIDCIKGGSCFFSYYPDNHYLSSSKILNSDFQWPVLATLLQSNANMIADSLLDPNQQYSADILPSVKFM